MKKKMKLSIEALEVDSFQAGGGSGGGTVQGHQETNTCSYGPTYYYTCQNCEQTAGFEATCGGVNTYCGTYPEVGCPNSVGYCTAYNMLC